MPSVSTTHRPLRPKVPRSGWRWWLMWSLFLLVLLSVTLGAAEIGLRWRRSIVASHITEPRIEDHRLTPDVLLGYKNHASYSYRSQNDAALPFDINALGFRGAEISRPKPAGVLRVILVGGSTVYGYYAGAADTISARLEAILRDRLGRPVEVINAGVPGYEGLREVLYLRSELLDLQPDAVVVLDGLNDAFFGSSVDGPALAADTQLRMMHDGRFPDLVSMVDQTTFPNGLAEYQLLTLLRNGWWQTGELVAQHHPRDLRTPNDRRVALYARSLGFLTRSAREAGVSVVVGLQPLLLLTDKPFRSEELLEASDIGGMWSPPGWPETARAMYPPMRAQARSAVESEGARFLDLTGVFDGESDATYAEDGVHYTPLGNTLIARAFAPVVASLLTPQ